MKYTVRRVRNNKARFPWLVRNPEGVTVHRSSDWTHAQNIAVMFANRHAFHEYLQRTNDEWLEPTA
jgi:hypothetical protein